MPYTAVCPKEVLHMENFIAFMRIVLDCFDQPFTLFGFNLSWWQVFLWSICGSIAAAFIGGMLR